MKKFREQILHSRIIYLVGCFAFIFTFLIGRLYLFQIHKHEELKLEALKQRGKAIQITPNRGYIYDRNLIPLTNSHEELTGFVYKKTIKENKELKELILNNTFLSREELESIIENGEEIISIPFNKEILEIEDSKDIYFTDKVFRYNRENILAHVIGYIKKAENKGEAGIEKLYDDVLSTVDSGNLYLEVDGAKNIIFGGEYAVDQKVPNNVASGVQLTIDYNIQYIIERILDKRKVKGAIIVAHKNGDILGMASRPNFNPDNIDEYLNREDMSLYNKAIQVSYPPGSIFKTVVLLAALENNMDLEDRIFYCKGYEEIGGRITRCNNIYGHGYISLKEGFAKSCNSVFIQLGQELGGQKLLDISRRLGFGQKLNIGLLEEISGNLPILDEVQGPAIGNISIGQGNLEATPLQITNMMVIIANKGVKKDLSIVKGITNSQGQILKEYHREGDERILDERISLLTQEYLANVLEEGTAKNISLNNLGGGGGKTGSAEAVFNGQITIHGWFSGFFPKDNPEYIITVLVEGGESGGKTAAPIFEEIAKKISKIK